MTRIDIRVRSCPRCNGAMDWEEPEEPRCMNCGHRKSWGSGISPLRSSLYQDRPVSSPRMIDTIRRDAPSGLSEGDTGTVECEVTVKKGLTRTVMIAYYVQRFTTRKGLYAVASSVTATGWQMPVWSSRFQTSLRVEFEKRIGLGLRGVAAALQAGDQ